MAYNLTPLFRHALINSEKKHFLKTIRYELLSTPAYLGKTKGKHISLSGEVAENATILTIREKIKDFSLPYDIGKA